MSTVHWEIAWNEDPSTIPWPESSTETLRKYIKVIKRTTAFFLIRQVSICSCSFSGCARVNWGQAPLLKHPIHSLFASQGSHISHIMPSCQHIKKYTLNCRDQVSHQGASWQRAPCTWKDHPGSRAYQDASQAFPGTKRTNDTDDIWWHLMVMMVMMMMTTTTLMTLVPRVLLCWNAHAQLGIGKRGSHRTQGVTLSSSFIYISNRKLVVSRCFMMFHDVSRCFTMFHCFTMFYDVSRCFTAQLSENHIGECHRTRSEQTVLRFCKLHHRTGVLNWTHCHYQALPSSPSGHIWSGFRTIMDVWEHIWQPKMWSLIIIPSSCPMISRDFPHWNGLFLPAIMVSSVPRAFCSWIPDIAGCSTPSTSRNNTRTCRVADVSGRFVPFFNQSIDEMSLFEMMKSVCLFLSSCLLMTQTYREWKSDKHDKRNKFHGLFTLWHLLRTTTVVGQRDPIAKVCGVYFSWLLYHKIIVLNKSQWHISPNCPLNILINIHCIPLLISLQPWAEGVFPAGAWATAADRTAVGCCFGLT